jgi:hypothetical protein
MRPLSRGAHVSRPPLTAGRTARGYAAMTWPSERAQGQVKAKGVYAQEGLLQPKPFFVELAKHDIKIE